MFDTGLNRVTINRDYNKFYWKMNLANKKEIL